MKLSLHSRPRQEGAVAVLFGLTVVVLFAMGGIVLDLGHLYIAKAELQNAADAAALAGAKELDESLAGINKAVALAQKIASKNKYNFSTDVTLIPEDFEFSSRPDGPWSSVAAAQASPAGKTFIKVNTGARVISTYLMRVAGPAFNTINTSGSAVAGKFVNDVTPIGVCAIDLNKGGTRPTTPPGADKELTQFGFRRGVSYNIFELGPLGGPSDAYLLNPVDAYPNTCNKNNASADNTAPFVCNGASAVLSTTSATVYGNTGISASKIQAALNSRFNDYSSPSVCIPAQAPPDSNIRKYPCTSGKGCVASPAGLPNTWMDPTTTSTPNNRQTFNLSGSTSLNDYGVLWSYSHAVKAVGLSPNATPGTPFTPADWPILYPTPPLSAEITYPGGLSGTTESPYLQPSGIYFQAPLTNPSTAKRRLLNLAIANCTPGAITGNGNCQVIPVLGVGRFFMQVPADFNGSPKKLEVEFAGLIEPVPTAEIKIYR